FSGLVMACLFAGWPTRTSPVSVKATTDGVVRVPSTFSITLAAPPSITATHELVVPRSIPTAFAMSVTPGQVLRIAFLSAVASGYETTTIRLWTHLTPGADQATRSASSH